MFIGHFGLAFAAKRAAPRTSLGTTFVAAQLADLFWPMFLLVGAEQVRICAREPQPVSHARFRQLSMVAQPGHRVDGRRGVRRAVLRAHALHGRSDRRRPARAEPLVARLRRSRTRSAALSRRRGASWSRVVAKPGRDRDRRADRVLRRRDDLRASDAGEGSHRPIRTVVARRGPARPLRCQLWAASAECKGVGVDGAHRVAALGIAVVGRPPSERPRRPAGRRPRPGRANEFVPRAGSDASRSSTTTESCSRRATASRSSAAAKPRGQHDALSRGVDQQADLRQRISSAASSSARSRSTPTSTRCSSPGTCPTADSPSARR